MLVIRLARTGRNKYPTYRIVAAESRYAATGKFIEILGHYNPHTKDLVLDKEGIAKRVDNGAQPSNTVLKLMLREGMELPKWAKIATKQRPPKKEPEAVEETAPAADTEVTPAEAAADADTTEAPEAVDASTKPEAETKATETTVPDSKADPDEKAAADGDAQEAAADAAEAVSTDVADKA